MPQNSLRNIHVIRFENESTYLNDVQIDGLESFIYGEEYESVELYYHYPTCKHFRFRHATTDNCIPYDLSKSDLQTILKEISSKIDDNDFVVFAPRPISIDPVVSNELVKDAESNNIEMLIGYVCFSGIGGWRYHPTTYIARHINNGVISTSSLPPASIESIMIVGSLAKSILCTFDFSNNASRTALFSMYVWSQPVKKKFSNICHGIVADDYLTSRPLWENNGDSKNFSLHEVILTKNLPKILSNYELSNTKAVLDLVIYLASIEFKSFYIEINKSSIISSIEHIIDNNLVSDTLALLADHFDWFMTYDLEESSQTFASRIVIKASSYTNKLDYSIAEYWIKLITSFEESFFAPEGSPMRMTVDQFEVLKNAFEMLDSMLMANAYASCKIDYLRNQVVDSRRYNEEARSHHATKKRMWRMRDQLKETQKEVRVLKRDNQALREKSLYQYLKLKINRFINAK